MPSTVPRLHALARLYGVQTSYVDVWGRRRGASAEALLRALRALGAPVAGPGDAIPALRERRQALWQRVCEPVSIAWDGQSPGLELRLPARLGTHGRLACDLALETGERRSWTCDLGALPVVGAAEVEGTPYQARRLGVPTDLPLGYHRLRVELAGRAAETSLISAPRRAYEPRDGADSRAWGVFLPLYALHSGTSWGAGDLADLEALVDWVGGLGGGVVALLPLLAALPDEDVASPYAPASRLFWNELYLDLRRVPELERCPAAREWLGSAAVRDEIAALRAAPLVDYRRQAALKRRALEELSRCLFAEPGGRQEALWRFVETHPALDDYACFRAVHERQRAPWPEWPEPLREGVLREGDYPEEARRYHLYVQWLADEQMAAVSARARRHGPGLYLDLPLGAHPHGYDAWRERDAFVLRATGGAPPDAFFTQGQDWLFPPLHPERIREQGYRYLRACLRTLFRHAGALRVDHVMGFHRLYWIPEGCTARDGVYVRYAAEELYAVLTLESVRHRALVVGEDLGTVPGYVRRAMARHGVRRTYVLQYEVVPDRQRPLGAPPPGSVASFNTHDMPPFAAYWEGHDIRDRLDLELLDRAGARQERSARLATRQALAAFLRRRGLLAAGRSDVRAVREAGLAYLASSRAELVLVNLEDLWLETLPQNVPGTGAERPNWRRKAALPFETFSRRPEVRDALQALDRERRSAARRRPSATEAR